MDNLTDIKRGRGRPRKTNLDEISPIVEEKAPRGRPRTRPIDEEPKVKQKPGRKTNISSSKEYFNEYYHNNYANNYVNCPYCYKPVQKCKLTRHMRGEGCFRDQMTKKYINNSIHEFIENNDEEFEEFCNYIIENPDEIKNPKLNNKKNKMD
jgi:hypothetical protein